jgi:hypothetical protein
MVLRFFQVCNAIHSREDSLDGGSDRCKVSTQTQNKRTDTSIPRVRLEPTTTAFRPFHWCADISFTFRYQRRDNINATMQSGLYLHRDVTDFTWHDRHAVML